MRARIVLNYSHISCQLREVVLKDKPPSLLEYSPKGTVPVLILRDGSVIDESLEVIKWALQRSDPDQWLGLLDEALIDRNDNGFKNDLDRYKYASRYEGADPQLHRTRAELFLAKLEKRLSQSSYLCGDALSATDVAIGPFVRQFANVDPHWFETTPYENVQRWLGAFVASRSFTSVMTKYPQWVEGDEMTVFPQ